MEERAVSVRGDVVVKIQEPAASRRERLRTLAGGEVGQRTGLFGVPDIVSFDDSRGEIVFRRLDLIEPWRALADPGHSLKFVGRAARALAAIHRDMALRDGITELNAGGAGIRAARAPVPLHGDFGLANIFCVPASDHIAVIDWANADWTGIDADLGAPEIDVAVFLISLFHRRLFASCLVARRQEAARHFLATYASASPQGLELDTLRGIVAAIRPRFNQLTRRRKGNLRALGYRHSMTALDHFLRRLSAESFRGRRDRHAG